MIDTSRIAARIANTEADRDELFFLRITNLLRIFNATSG
jgi:hypothetical protein